MRLNLTEVCKKYPEVVLAGDAAARRHGTGVFFLFRVKRKVTYGLTREAYGDVEPFWSLVVK